MHVAGSGVTIVSSPPCPIVKYVRGRNESYTQDRTVFVKQQLNMKCHYINKVEPPMSKNRHRNERIVHPRSYVYIYIYIERERYIALVALLLLHYYWYYYHYVTTRIINVLKLLSVLALSLSIYIYTHVYMYIIIMIIIIISSITTISYYHYI